MSNAKVNYSDLVKLGFKKMEINDCVHESQYGYPYFILTYGDIEINCSLKAVFDENMDRLKDMLSTALF